MRKNSRKSANYTAKPSKYPQGRFREKSCRWCKEKFSPVAPSHLYCSDVCKDEAYSDNYYNRTYGISYFEYKEILEKQKGKCAICGGSGFKMHEGIKESLVVDHCHKAEGYSVRGLLCNNCNRGLGLFQDDIVALEKAIEYLNDFRRNAETARRETRRALQKIKNNKT